LTHRATTSTAVVALIFSVAALLTCVYSVYLEPTRVKLRIQEIEATNELTKNLGQLVEFLKEERERAELIKPVRVEKE
jgi:hypothetical protein